MRNKGSQSKYSSAFNAASILYREFNALIQITGGHDLIIVLLGEVRNNNLLAIKTESARQRVVQEMIKRVQKAPEGFWAFFSNCSDQEKRLSLFYLCLKTYPLLFDFHFEVTIPRWRMHTNDLETYDIRIRLDQISSFDDYVYNWSEKTKEKVISRYLGILIDSGLMTNKQLVQPQDLSVNFRDYYTQNGESWFLEACLLPNFEF
jgi:hypothetical protein